MATIKLSSGRVIDTNNFTNLTELSPSEYQSYVTQVTGSPPPVQSSQSPLFSQPAQQMFPDQGNAQVPNITPMTDANTPSGSGSVYGDNRGAPYLTNNSYGQPEASPQIGDMPPNIINGNPAEQYTGGGYYAGSSYAPLISFLPQASQDYYGARGVQNFDPTYGPGGGGASNLPGGYDPFSSQAMPPIAYTGAQSNQYANTPFTFVPGGTGLGLGGSNYVTSYANGGYNEGPGVGVDGSNYVTSYANGTQEGFDPSSVISDYMGGSSGGGGEEA